MLAKSELGQMQGKSVLRKTPNVNSLNSRYVSSDLLACAIRGLCSLGRAVMMQGERLGLGEAELEDEVVVEAA